MEEEIVCHYKDVRWDILRWSMVYEKEVEPPNVVAAVVEVYL